MAKKEKAEGTEIAEAANTLPAAMSAIAQGVVAEANPGMAGTGVQFMKLDKGTGEFIYGVDDTETEDGSEWAFALGIPGMAQRGFIGWGDAKHGTEGEMLGESMVAFGQPPINPVDLEDIDGSWSECYSIQVQCVSGEDKGTVAVFKSNSKGGVQGIKKLLQTSAARIGEDPEESVAIMHLDSEFYTHKKYGKIWKPIFNVARWATMDDPGESEPEAAVEEVAPEPEEPVAEEPRRRRRRTAA